MAILNSWFCIFSFWLALVSIQADYTDNLIKGVQPFDTFYTQCGTKVTCDANSKFRTIDGKCNNLQNPLWGSSGTPYLRLGPANYADGDHKIRLQLSGNPLPNPREVHLQIFFTRAYDQPDIRNFHVNQVGQWTAHDITLMAANLSEPADCCAAQSLPNIPPVCQAVVPIAANDFVYSAINKSCIPFRRAMTSTLDFNCPITPQIPVNGATAFIDLSQLYGHTTAKSSQLRSNVGGKLKTVMINGQEFTVQEKRNSSSCDGRNGVSSCLDGGDIRHNQHFGIILYQAMFTRFHNDVAELLQKINPGWSDEILFLETRKFLIAVNQIVVYRDYLPTLLGENYVKSVGLSISKDQRTVYNPTMMPQLAVEFPGAAFRVPHNTVPSIYYFLDRNNLVVKELNLNEFMSFPDTVEEGSNFEEILRGMTRVPGRAPVAGYNFQISNFMFHNFIKSVGDQDLLLLDIQRGRDIGVPTYTKMRELCGLSKVATFDDLMALYKTPMDVALLQSLYETVDDVDLMVGALLETPAADSMVGETASCIIADGFYRLRYADRFFFDVDGQPGSFTQEQLDVLWSLDLTKIFCSTSTIDQLPENIFCPNNDSSMYDCKTPLNLNLEAWRQSSNTTNDNNINNNNNNNNDNNNNNVNNAMFAITDLEL